MVRRGKSSSRTLTLRETLYFTPESGGDGLTSRSAGSKVSVTFSPGIGFATAYVQQYDGRMFTAAVRAADGPGMFTNWPKSWTSEVQS